MDRRGIDRVSGLGVFFDAWGHGAGFGLSRGDLGEASVRFANAQAAEAAKEACDAGQA